MSDAKNNYVEECLKGKKCKDCPTCIADAQSWHQLELDFSETNSNFALDLQTYYLVKGKRKIFEQEKNGEYITLSEAEALHMFSRY